MTELLSIKQSQTCRQTFPQATFRLHTVDLDRLEEEICGQEQHVARIHLSPAEQSRFFSFNYRKRQIEWLGGRIAAKNSTSELLLAKGYQAPGPSELSIDSSPDGRPLLNPRHRSTPIDISISHSKNRAAAMAVDYGCCGIDIQEITQTTIKVKSRFLSQEEERFLLSFPGLQKHSTETAFTLIWAAKESFRKCFISNPILGFFEVCLTGLRGTIQEGLIGSFRCSRPGLPQQISAFFTLSGTMATAIAIQYPEKA